MTLTPTRESFSDLAVQDAAIARLEAPLSVDATPLAAYTALADRDSYSFLLESAEKVASSNPNGAFSPDPIGDRHARYSFVGYDPAAVVALTPTDTTLTVLRDAPITERLPRNPPTDGDVLDRLRAFRPDVPLLGFPETERQHLDGGLVGYLAYDAVYDLWLDDVGLERPATPVPDAEFLVTTNTIVFDHAADTATLVFTPLLTPDTDPAHLHDALADEADRVAAAIRTHDPDPPGGFERSAETSGSRADYEAAVRRAKEHVLDGDIYQGVISRKRVQTGRIDPVALYAALRDINPSPYMYLLGFGDRSIVGASPETLVSVRGRTVVSNPIAGTCPRGDSPVEDRRLAGEMLADDKERAEHTMLVDLARNDLRRVCAGGTVQVEEFMNVLKYSHVQHIESTVTGRLTDPHDAFDATRATFPAGTLTGAPKIRAMEIIHALEPDPRGVYGGGVGYYSWSGDADFAIVIRTATIDHADPDTVTVQAGAGIVADSDPASEYDETESKMDGVLDALDHVDTRTEPEPHQ